MKKLLEWSVVAITLFGIFGAYSVVFIRSEAKKLGDDPNPQTSSIKAAEVSDINISDLYRLTNQDRENAGLAPLELSNALQQSAKDKCDDMVAKNYYEHDAPDGTHWYTFINKYTTYQAAGENITMYYSKASAQAANTEFMQSEEHKKNILDPKFTHVSFAVCHTESFSTEKYPAIFIVEHFIQAP